MVTDPFDRSVGSLGKLAADIVTLSHSHPGHSNRAGVSGEPRVVDGPGEYEIKGVVITGFRTYHDAEGGKTRGQNTAYLVEMDDLVVCHLGDLGHALNASQVEALSKVDVLMVPVGGVTTINASQAAEVISLIEPKIVVPMHYRTAGSSGGGGELDTVDRFCREMGTLNLAPQPKLMVTPSSLPEGTQVVLLEPRRG